MKTIKALKSVTIWNFIFLFSWILTFVCLSIDSNSIGILAVYGWMVNPFAIIACIRCLKIYLKERKDPISNRLIAKKWVWIFLWPVFTTILWGLGGGLFVYFTGGV